MKQTRHRLLLLLSLIPVSILLLVSLQKCYVDMREMILHGDNGDLQIFINAGIRFFDSGQLYDRPDSIERPTVESVYRPSSSVFKFPPAFQLQLIPFTKKQPDALFFRSIRVLMLLAYFATCIIVMLEVLKKFKPASGVPLIIFIFISAITATSSDGLRLGIFLINYEIPIFTLLIAAYFLSKNNNVISGAIIGYLATAKIYPAFMVTYFLAGKNSRQTLAFAASIMFFSGAAYYLFGVRENHFYFTQAFPILIFEKVAQLYYNMSLGNLLEEILQEPIIANAAFNAVRVLFIAASIFILIKRQRHNNPANMEVFSLLMVLMIINMPNYWQAYQVMLFPGLCIATRKTLTSPSLINVPVLLLSIASMSVDVNAWAHTASLQLASSGTIESDHFAQTILQEFQNNGVFKTILKLAPEYPLVACQYFLAKIKPLIPYILWFALANEVTAQTARENTNQAQKQ